METGVQMRTFISCMFLLLFAAGLTAQEATYRYAQGQEYRYLVEGSSLRMQEVQGQTIQISSETTVSAVLTSLASLDEGHQRLQILVENALVISESPNGSQTLGADVGGKSIVFEIDHKGDVVDVDTALKAYDGESIGILQSMLNFFPTIETDQLSEGTEWEVEGADTTGQGESQRIVEYERVYAVKGRKDVEGIDCYEVTITTNSDIDGKIVQGDNEMMITGTQELKATAYLASENGILVSLEAEITGDSVVMIPSNNMRVPITESSTRKITLLP